jgi:hypothetical protein
VLLALPGGSGLVVHDTGTRGWRRRHLPAGLAGEGWASVRLLDRPAADRLRRVEIPAR